MWRTLGSMAPASLVIACVGSDPQVPTSIDIAPSAVTFDALGARETLSATVFDQDGDPITGATVDWASTAADVATVGSLDGVVTAAGNGSAQIIARSADVTGRALATVAQVPTAVVAVSGDAQSGLANNPLPFPVVMRVADRLQSPAVSVTMTFALTGGNGTIDPTTTTTNEDGEASARWILGPELGANTLEVVVDGLPTVTVTASAVLGEPEIVNIHDGDGQTATVNTDVAVPPSVRVADGGNVPIEGAMVVFEVAGGGGAIAGAVQTTDAYGIATVGRWTVGTVAGENLLVARASGGFPVVIGAFGAADVPTQIEMVEGDGQLALVNSEVPINPAVRLRDQFDNLVPGVEVTFTASVGSGIVTGSPATSGSDGVARVAGWLLGPDPGTHQVEATAGALGPVVFSAEAVTIGAPASVTVVDGDGQTGRTAAPINFPPAVRVRDANAFPVPGAEVVFAVAAGGGTLSGEIQTTATDGVARVGGWTLGGGQGINTLMATVTGGGITGNPVTFTATGITPAFDIVVRQLNAPTASQAAAFDAAEVSWERLLIGDTPGFDFTGMPLGAGACGVDHPEVAEVVDDLLVFAVLEAIDGPGAILGQAGPCVVPGHGFPAVGIMFFDTADLADLENEGLLDDVVRHEMGHVLGFGASDAWYDLLTNPSFPNNAGVDTHFPGPNAISTFDLVGGITYVGGQKVPVENALGGGGTRDAHWRELVFDTELMTGFLNSSAANPLSVVSVAAMGDLGYVFNLSGADGFVLPLAAAAPRTAGARIALADDVWRGPRYTVDGAGRIVRLGSENR